MTVTDIFQSVQYMVDEDGKRTAAVIDIAAWKMLTQLFNAPVPDDLCRTTDFKTPEQVVAHIQSLPIESDSVIPARGSLLEVLQNPTYEDEDFDLDEWTKQWAAVEREMKETTRRNDIAEGRG